jgi:hypothetical protein
VGSSLARHLEERLISLPPRPISWFVRRLTPLAKLIRRREHHLGTFQALGFPVGKPQRLLDGSLFFELFVFDLSANGEPIDSPVGVRAMCLLPRRAHGPIETLSQSEELDMAGDVVWSNLFGGYVLRINGLQAVTRGR